MQSFLQYISVAFTLTTNFHNKKTSVTLTRHSLARVPLIYLSGEGTCRCGRVAALRLAEGGVKVHGACAWIVYVLTTQWTGEGRYLQLQLYGPVWVGLSTSVLFHGGRDLFFYYSWTKNRPILPQLGPVFAASRSTRWTPFIVCR